MRLRVVVIVIIIVIVIIFIIVVVAIIIIIITIIGTVAIIIIIIATPLTLQLRRAEGTEVESQEQGKQVGRPYTHPVGDAELAAFHAEVLEGAEAGDSCHRVVIQALFHLEQHRDGGRGDASE